MLEIPSLPVDAETHPIITKFINARLISIMEREIEFHAIAMGKEFDIDELEQDLEFAKGCALLFLPENYSITKANYTFFGLYRLLRARREYEPELAMRYVLYEMICQEIDLLKDEGKDTVERMPEPGRKIVLHHLDYEVDSMMAMIEEELEIDGRTFDGKEDYTPEDAIRPYEDLNEYKQICFKDWDFLMLDQMDGSSLRNSPLSSYIGIQEKLDGKEMEFSIGTEVGIDQNMKNVRFEINMPPWERE